jgi:hypothetical protein
MLIARYFKDYEIDFVNFDRLELYVKLLNECFPDFHVSEQYLKWLYFENYKY